MLVKGNYDNHLQLRLTEALLLSKRYTLNQRVQIQLHKYNFLLLSPKHNHFYKDTVDCRLFHKKMDLESNHYILH